MAVKYYPTKKGYIKSRVPITLTLPGITVFSNLITFGPCDALNSFKLLENGVITNT